MSVAIKSSNVDDRRRVVLPESCPPNSAVTIQELDGETWLVKRRLPANNIVMVAFEHIARLPDDPEWEKKKADLAQRSSDGAVKKLGARLMLDKRPSATAVQSALRSDRDA